MLAKSESFTGEWPEGTHWHPGEIREVANLADAPAGIVPVQPPAPAKPAKPPKERP